MLVSPTFTGEKPARSGVQVAHDILKRVANDKKPRIFQNGRDMAINAVLIVVLMLVAVGATGLCSFNPGAPESGPVQEVDAKAFLDLEARAVNYPVRYPQMPEGWTTNSARRSMLAGNSAPVVGWVTPNRGYLQLTQTGVDKDAALQASNADNRMLDRTVRIDDTDVEVYTSDEREVRDLWIVDAGDARFVVTGAGSTDEFEELISAALKATPITPQ